MGAENTHKNVFEFLFCPVSYNFEMVELIIYTGTHHQGANTLLRSIFISLYRWHRWLNFWWYRIWISFGICFFQPEYKMADPICTFLFSLFVLCTTFTIVRDILLVLMEGKAPLCFCTMLADPRLHFSDWHLFICASGTPAGVKYSEVRDGLLEVKGVTAVHNLHIWALTMNQAVLSAHVAIGEKKPAC